MSDNSPNCLSRLSIEGSPYVHLFKAENSNFVLDLNTNRMFSLNDQEAQLFQEWVDGGNFSELSRKYAEAAQSISVMRDQGLFCCERPQGLSYGCDWEELVDQILHKRERTILEITQQCNLRCRYCTFGGGFEDHRKHSAKRMHKDLIRKSIETAFQHGSDLEQIGFGFYGGEPLLAFDLVQTAVDIAETKACGKSIRFAITTNATLIDKKKAEFLRDKNFNVLVSLDGPQAMHDRYRVYPNGVGSYSHTIQGLQTILEVFPPETHQKIGLSMVVPDSRWIPALEDLWDTEPWLPRSLRTTVSVVNPPRGLEPPAPSQTLTSTVFSDQWIDHLRTREKGKTSLESTVFESSYAKLHQRPMFPNYRKTFFPNGCCIPGARKIFVDAEGSYQICERVHGVPIIGSVENGIDLPAVKRIISDYCKYSFQDCRDCFLISICSQCFLHAYKKGAYDIVQKREHCKSALRSMQSRLNTYVKVSRDFPHKLDEWENIDIK